MTLTRTARLIRAYRVPGPKTFSVAVCFIACVAAFGMASPLAAYGVPYERSQPLNPCQFAAPQKASGVGFTGRPANIMLSDTKTKIVRPDLTKDACCNTTLSCCVDKPKPIR